MIVNGEPKYVVGEQLHLILDELGYSPIDSEFSGEGQLEDLDGEIEITVNRDKSKYEFEKNSVEIDNREEQDWREV